jgi:hypothetical protein
MDGPIDHFLPTPQFACRFILPETFFLKETITPWRILYQITIGRIFIKGGVIS